MNEPESKTPGFTRRLGLSDLALAALVLAVIVMLVAPLTQWVLDLLIGLNLCLSVTVFATAVFVRRPLGFTALPTVLLVATLFRLALNVSSTRLILLEADAGRIIGAFGGILVGGDILVGAAIFGIVAMVLFVVITKGAERVAEVAARFTLDALPGMQLAIDADLRAGAIGPREVARRRADLEGRSHYYGALDGAMKFVRGDALASLVIIAVNIAGGLAVGIVRRGMPVGEALDTYGRLTVGDGLVTLIPALLISTAAGLLVTRLGQPADGLRLGQQLARQFLAEPRALFVAAALMLALAAVPGLPAWPFLLLGAATAGAGALALSAGQRARDAGRLHGGTAADGDGPGLDEVQELLDRVAERRPVLVREAVPRVATLPVLADLLRELGRDPGLSSGELPRILEALARQQPGLAFDELLQRVRRHLAPLITALVAAGRAGPIRAAVPGEELEAVIRSGLVRSGDGWRLALSAGDAGQVVALIRGGLAGLERPVLLVAPEQRRELARLLRTPLPELTVLAHGELGDDTPVEVVARI